MKYKLRLISVFCCLLFVVLPFPAAADQPGLRPPSGWADAAVYKARWNAQEDTPAVFRAVFDPAANQIFICMELTGGAVHAGTQIRSQLIIRGNGDVWLLDLPDPLFENEQAAVTVQTETVAPEGTQSLLYTMAITLSQPGQYEIALTCLLGEKEIRPDSPISLSTLPPSTAATKATQPERSTKATTAPHTSKSTAAPKSTAAKTKAAADSTRQKQAASAGAATQAVTSEASASFFPPEEANFFQQMSPGTKAVFVCAVLAGAAALVITGIAIGNKHKPVPPEDEDDEISV